MRFRCGSIGTSSVTDTAKVLNNVITEEKMRERELSALFVVWVVPLRSLRRAGTKDLVINWGNNQRVGKVKLETSKIGKYICE
jgi:hypothetical protein